jgi:hypothetical protein
MGHEVKLGSRNPAQDKIRAWLDETGASAGTFDEAASFAEVAVLATDGDFFNTLAPSRLPVNRGNPASEVGRKGAKIAHFAHAPCRCYSLCFLK